MMNPNRRYRCSWCWLLPIALLLLLAAKSINVDAIVKNTREESESHTSKDNTREALQVKGLRGAAVNGASDRGSLMLQQEPLLSKQERKRERNLSHEDAKALPFLDLDIALFRPGPPSIMSYSSNSDSTGTMSATAKKEETTYRVIIQYQPNTKPNIQQALEDLVAAEANAKNNKNTNARSLQEEEETTVTTGTLEVHYDFEELNSYVATMTKAQIMELSHKTRRIASIHIDPKRTAYSSVGAGFLPQRTRTGSRRRRELMSNTTSTQQQTLPYGVDMVQAPELWNLGVTGQNAKVCVIDSGIDGDNADFNSANLDGTDTPAPWDRDPCQHGTHVAGTIAARNNNEGVVGIAHGANLFVVRIFSTGPTGCGEVYASDLVSAAEMCRVHGADIINISLGGEGRTLTERNKFQTLFDDYGILTVASAGNEGQAYGQDNTGPGSTQRARPKYPASYNSVISVAAVDQNGVRPEWSEWNPYVDLTAPGVNITSVRSLDLPEGATMALDAAQEKDEYDPFRLNITGTSMSAPHVAGVAALLKSAFGSAVTASDLRAALLSSALPKQGSAPTAASNANATHVRNDEYGYGIVQAKAAYDCLVAGTCVLPDENVCEDVVIQKGQDETFTYWHDPDGETFTCQWYAYNDNCEHFGETFTNYGYTANQACCMCGGGVKTLEALATPLPFSHDSAPSAQPSMPPSTAPSATPSVSLVPSSNPTASWVPSTPPSVSLVPSSNPTATMTPSASPSVSVVPSSNPTATMVPSAPPSVSLVPSSNPTATMAPSASPSISIVPSSNPTASWVPSAPPSVSLVPSSNPTASWVVLEHNDFVNRSWRAWSDGGSDASLLKAGDRFTKPTSTIANANETPSLFPENGYERTFYAARLRDNSKSSVMTRKNLPPYQIYVSDYVYLKVEFTFVAEYMEDDESLMLQVWDSNNDNGWITVQTWYCGEGKDFVNDVVVWNQEVILPLLSSSDTPLSPNELDLLPQIRFKCNGSTNKDRIWLDYITLSARPS
jgi:subtilisin family serine protease